MKIRVDENERNRRINDIRLNIRIFEERKANLEEIVYYLERCPFGGVHIDVDVLSKKIEGDVGTKSLCFFLKAEIYETDKTLAFLREELSKLSRKPKEEME